MNSRPFQALIDLVRLDQHLRSLREAVTKNIQAIQELQRQKSALDDAKEQTKRKIVIMHKEVDMQELAMKELDTQEQQKKRQLEAISHYKEYQSMKSEVDHIQREQQAQEQRLVDAWNQLENAQKELANLIPLWQEKLNAIQHEIEQKEEAMRKSEQEIATLQEQRPTLELKVPEEWLQKYTLMQARVVDPIVPIVQGSCNACFYKVTVQDTARARNGELLQCKSCYRLLFLEEALGSLSSKNDGVLV